MDAVEKLDWRGSLGLLIEEGHHQHDVSCGLAWSGSRIEKPSCVVFLGGTPVGKPLFGCREGKTLGYRVGIWVIRMSLHPKFAFDGWVPVVLDGVVGPSREPLGDQSPFVSHPTVKLKLTSCGLQRWPDLLLPSTVPSECQDWDDYATVICTVCRSCQVGLWRCTTNSWDRALIQVSSQVSLLILSAC